MYFISKLPSLYFLFSQRVPDFFLFSPCQKNKTCDLGSSNFEFNSDFPYNDCLEGRVSIIVLEIDDHPCICVVENFNRVQSYPAFRCRKAER